MSIRARRVNLYVGLHVAIGTFGGVMCVVPPGVVLDPWKVPTDDPTIVGLSVHSRAHMLTIALFSAVMLFVEPPRLRHGGTLSLAVWHALIVYAAILIGRAGADMTSGIGLHAAWAVWGFVLLLAFRERTTGSTAGLTASPAGT